MSESKPICPRCGSQHTVKNGRIHNKKPKHKCQDCGRQFIENPTKKYISPPTLDYINKMLLEKIPLAGIARVTGVSRKVNSGLRKRLVYQGASATRSDFKAFRKVNYRM